MFKDLGNGYIDIPDNAFGFVFRCYLPPIGYGLNAANGLVQETDILLSSEIPTEQLWERPTLPHDFKIRRVNFVLAGQAMRPSFSFWNSVLLRRPRTNNYSFQLSQYHYMSCSICWLYAHYATKARW